MLKNLGLYIFICFFSIGLLMSIMSNNWILIWCGLEFMLISLIPMILSKKFNSSECVMKYFIIQSLSSFILVLSIMLMLMNLKFNMELILNISLMIKMGVAPFHSWVLNVIEGLNFYPILTIFTLMKIPPLCILSYNSNYLFLFILMTLVFGSILSLNQSSCRKIIGYSSIFNMGFILSCISVNQVWMFYLLFYSLMMLMLIYLFNLFNLNYCNQFIINNFSIFNKFVLLMMLLSLGGMPPLIGFMIKLIVLEYMLFNKLYLVSFVMIMFSLLVMFIYIRMTFLSVMIFSYMTKINLTMNMYFSTFILFLNFTLLTMLMNTKLY